MTSSPTNLDDFNQRYNELFGSPRLLPRQEHDGPDQRDETHVSKATRAIELIRSEAVEIWQSLDGDAYTTFEIDGITSHLEVEGSSFGKLLRRRYYETYEDSLPNEALSTATATVAAQAEFGGASHPVFARVAHHDGAVWVDLGDESWDAVHIDARGWQIVPSLDVPVRFRRTASTRALPVPAVGGSLDELFRLVRLESEQRMLVEGWIVGCFQTSGGRALLELVGQQGSGKSTLARMLVDLVDPCEVPARSLSTNEENLLIAVKGRAVLAFDNLSQLRGDMADALCRLSTGGGIGKRRLYTNADETLMKAQLPLVWTSIAPIAIDRPDLQDRTLTVQLHSLEGATYRTESEITTRFESMRPQLLGAIYDAVSMALQQREMVRPERLPRLADFAAWVEAAGPALGWGRGAFVTVMEEASLAASRMSVDVSPVGRLIVAFVETHPRWKGSVSTLYAELRQLGGEASWREDELPKSAAVFGKELRRMVPPLRRIGIRMDFDRDRTANLVTLERDAPAHRNQ